MKKTLAVLLALCLLLCTCTSLSEEAPEGKYDELVVGTTTAFNGNFYSMILGNNGSDVDVQRLIHGYNLVRWDTEFGSFRFDDSVVTGVAVTEDPNGNRTFNLALASDLYWSDGTPITAKDYAFTVLLSVDPAIEETGASIFHAGYVLGYDNYINGTNAYLSGLRVVSDNMLAITISGAYRPFFYEMGLLSIVPTPISIVAPGNSVADDGNGAYLTAKLNADELKTTLTGDEGYISNPKLTCGAYKLLSFDGTTAKMEINEFYKGNYLGNKPMVQHLTYTLATNETMIDELAAGNFGLLNKATNKDTIAYGIEQIAGGDISMSAYARNGMSYFSFCFEKLAVAQQAVRQAIAQCIDRETLAYAYTGDYGLVVDGYYGLGQWMYQVASGTLKPEVEPEKEAELDEQLAVLTMENIPTYTYDVDAAKALLEKDGWKVGEDGIRSKDIDGETVKLQLKLIYPEGNRIADLLEENMVAPLKEAGIELTVEPVEFTKLLAMYYGDIERDCDMIYLASNFSVIYDPAETFDPAQVGTMMNPTGIQNENLYNLAVDMRSTVPGEVVEYCQKWVAFQECFMDQLPMIPLYSNAYFDFYQTELREYYVSDYVSWGDAIINAYLSDYMEEETEGEEEIIFD